MPDGGTMGSKSSTSYDILKNKAAVTLGGKIGNQSSSKKSHRGTEPKKTLREPEKMNKKTPQLAPKCRHRKKKGKNAGQGEEPG